MFLRFDIAACMLQCAIGRLELLPFDCLSIQCIILAVNGFKCNIS